jgi:uncharacterized protein (UPF0335 family)
MAGNGYNKQLLQALLSEIDDADDRLASLKGEYMANCQPVREDIAAVFQQAKDKGVGVKAFRILVSNHRLEKSKRRNEQKLDLDQRADYEQMREALGVLAELPLGEAALREARPVEEALNIG